MRRRRRLSVSLTPVVVVVFSLLPALPAAAGPEEHRAAAGTAALPAFGGPDYRNMTLLGNSDKDGTVNSDLAFWGDLLFAGNYNGFRILNVADPAAPQVLVDYFCRGPQSDLSVYRVAGRLLLFQSIDAPQSQESCNGSQAGSSHDVVPSSPFGFEGIRMFDVTDPRTPRFLDGIPTACGSHTHTPVPDDRRQRLHLYISSYPLGPAPPGGPPCTRPHRKISIVTVPFSDPLAWTVREKALSQDTVGYRGITGPDAVQGCHDVQVSLRHNIAVGSCLGDVQIWDISDPANPTAGDGEPHTHITSGGVNDSFEFIHSAAITWDGAYVAVMDESGGGWGALCDGSAPEQGGQSRDSFYYFFPLVAPGAPPPALLSRYMIPRPQASQICESHNGGFIPLKGRYVLSAGFYQGGNTVADFTDPARPVEVAYSDASDTTGTADSWAAYWFNDVVYASGGFARLTLTENRGIDLLSVQQQDGSRLMSVTQHHLNPQTQDRRAARPTVFREAQGGWFVRGGAPETVFWGTAGDIPVPADYDDDGLDDVAVFRPSQGVWYLRGGSATPTAVAWGTDGDVPAPADYGGDGDDDVALFRPSQGVWYLGGGSATPTAVAWGTNGDVPVPADYDGDGDDDVAVFRPSTGTWLIRNGAPGARAWGTNGDVPVPADYDGDGDDEPAVFRPSQGIWFVAGGSPGATAFGTNGDVPVPADYDGDGDDDIALFRASQGVWHVQGGAPPAVAWGTQNDVPVPARRA